VVHTGLLEREATKLNEAYIHSMREGRPFVHLKLACSLDGRIATHTGDSRWITGTQSRARVHELRHQYDAILIGAGTALTDDPLLTDRSGNPRRRPLVRVLLDERLSLSPQSNLATSAKEFPLLIFTSESAPESSVSALARQGVEIIRDTSGGRDLSGALHELGRRSIQSVLVEGGANVAAAFLEAGLVNRVSFFIAPIIIGGTGAPTAVGGSGAQKIADAASLEDVEVIRRGRDVEVTGYVLKDEG
jgi:diaminohydroxyphosphoribosylaminopyrimidine deaminase/5-amino-6-(5-phosphoribosylamino)uracil reductase